MDEEQDGTITAPQRQSRSNSRTAPATIAQLREYVGWARNGWDGRPGLNDDQMSTIVLGMAERGLSMDEARDTFMQILAERQRIETSGFRGGASDFVTRSAQGLATSGSGQTFDNPQFLGARSRMRSTLA